MLRFLALATTAIVLAFPVSAVLVAPERGNSVADMLATTGDERGTIELSEPGTIRIIDPVAEHGARLGHGPDLAALELGALLDTAPGASAQPSLLDAGSLFPPAPAAERRFGHVGEALSEAPVPAGVVLTGTVMAGLGALRRRPRKV